MVSAADAVQTQGIHIRTAPHLVKQISDVVPASRKAVRLDGEADNDKGIRILFFQIARNLREPLRGGIRLKQEILCAIF